MAKKLYLLLEELRQVNYKTKVKHLYTSEVNHKLVMFLESKEEEFVYISHSEGILDPNVEMEPYKVKLVKDVDLWSLFCGEMISRFCRERGFDTLVFLFNGEQYEKLESKIKSYSITIENPLKFFRTKELKIRWIDSELQKGVCNRLKNNNVISLIERRGR